MKEPSLGIPKLKPPLHNSASPRDKEPSDDIARVLKWQEERISRRLKGEYESAVLHLSEIVQNNMNTKMNISSVRVEGAKNTRFGFLGFLINPILASSSPISQNDQDSGTLGSVLHTTRGIASILQKSDVFHSVEARIERAQDVLSSEGDVDVVFKTKEKGRYFLNTSTELGNEEGSASATGRIRNVFGGAEVLEANVSLGTKTRRSYRASLTAPITSDLETFAELLLFGTERDNTAYASCKEHLRGLKAIVRSGTPQIGAHEFVYEAVLRGVVDLSPNASISMREAAGQTSKSSVSYSYLLDTRNDKFAPTRGYYFRTFSEFAGLGGSALFLKNQLEGHVSRPIWDGLSFSLAARTGILWGLSKPTLFSDRFQLGGPTSIRAFKSNSMGPRDGSDFIGGDLYWSGGASIISNIPHKPHWPVKTHLWLNFGRLDAIDRGRSLLDNVRDTLTRPSVSTGVGLIYRFDPVRVEVNLGVPLVASKSDGSRRGIQVGVGLEFL